MQTWTFLIWTLAHLLVVIAVAMTAPVLTTLAVFALAVCSQIGVWFNARLDESVFEETTTDGPANVLRSFYMLGPLAILALTGTVLFLQPA